MEEHLKENGMAKEVELGKTEKIAKEVAEVLIKNFNPLEQRRTLEMVEDIISIHYQHQISEAEKMLEERKYSFHEFKNQNQ